MISTQGFRPRSLDLIGHYSWALFWKDLGAGTAVAIVALPLAMAFAIASGLSPQVGLLTAIVGGFLVSALGGSRVQIGGPAGAFIVIVYDIVERFGVGGLLVATALSGLMLFCMGLFRLGVLIRFIPVAVIIGFTNGIAVLIMLSQLKDLLGLPIDKMPADFFGILHALYTQLQAFSPITFVIGLATLFWIVMWQFFLPKLKLEPFGMQALKGVSGKQTAVPGSIVAITVASLTVYLLQLPVTTIGSRFGGIPTDVFNLSWPELSWQTARLMLMPALTLAVLGAIESLLCARVADGLSKADHAARHDPNQELMAQGVANFITPLFGGMPVTGTIARTVTNIKNGAESPVAGMLHALILLLIVWLAAPLAKHVPLAALAAVLLFVAWNMGEWREFAQLRHFRMPYRITLLLVFTLTVVLDLTIAIEVGLLAACVTFIYRISSLSRLATVDAESHPLLAGTQGQVKAYRLYGALFFGAVKMVDEIGKKLPSEFLIVDLKNIIYIDSSGADALKHLLETCHANKVQLIFCGVTRQPLDILARSQLTDQLLPEQMQDDLQSALLFVYGMA